MNYGMMISLVILFGAQLAHSLGWIDDATYQAIITGAGGGGAGSLAVQLAANNKQSATRQAILGEQMNVPRAVLVKDFTGPAGVPVPPPTPTVVTVQRGLP